MAELFLGGYDYGICAPRHPAGQTGTVYRLSDAKSTAQLEIGANADLKLYGRPGEDLEAFQVRCRQEAESRADAEIAKLRDKYESKATKIRNRAAAQEDRIDVLEAQSSSKRNSELLSTAGSVLGGLLGGKKSSGGLLGGRRVDEAANKLDRLLVELEDLETELADGVAAIGAKWSDAVADTTTIAVGLEANDVKVVQLSLTWIPIA